MSEADAIAASPGPVTREILARDLENLGLRNGMAVLVHTALSRLGWVVGGAETVIHALIDAAGRKGTLLMPAFSADRSDPEGWSNPPVPHTWWQTVRDTMPAFNPRTTPTRGLGAVAELFRTWPGACRSAHPQSSFSALGPQAEELMRGHWPGMGLGENSPLARLYDADGQVLFLGAGFNACTAFHLAEIRARRVATVTQHTAIQACSRRRWIAFEDMDYDEDDFARIGAAFMQTGRVRTGRVGAGTGTIFSIRHGIDFAVDWMKKNRTRTDQT